MSEEEYVPHAQKRWRASVRIFDFIEDWLPFITALAFAGLFLLPYATLGLVGCILALYLFTDVARRTSSMLRFAIWLVIALGFASFGVFMLIQQIIVWIWGYPPLPGN